MPIERILAEIMFADIAGYTEQISKDEAVAISLLVPTNIMNSIFNI